MHDTRFRTMLLDDVKLFFREAGDRSLPTLLLLHGLPASSHMFRDLLGRMKNRFHLLAPDYPGFGNSEACNPQGFEYTFDRLSVVIERFLDALGIQRMSLYMHGGGLPVGMRIAGRHPDRITALIIQNGNCYEDGFAAATKPLFDFWYNRTPETEAAVRRFITREGIIWQYVDGVRDRERISPDGWMLDSAVSSQPGNGRAQLDLLYDYRKNLELYPQWQTFLREHQPPTLVLWGRNDPIYSPEGALAYHRDLNDVEFHLLDSGHFALEDCGYEIAQHVVSFLERVHEHSRDAIADVSRADLSML